MQWPHLSSIAIVSEAGVNPAAGSHAHENLKTQKHKCTLTYTEATNSLFEMKPPVAYLLLYLIYLTTESISAEDLAYQ